MSEFANYLGIHEPALYTQARRAEVLAANLANVDTPGYKSRDIDFRQLLAGDDSEDAMSALRQTRQGHIAVNVAGSEDELLYRQPHQASLDGNTVEHQVELSAYSDNSMRYLASLRFINGKLNTLRTAIRGQ
jgi:flagellar basal-body rod protein FlgB